ncbi:MAG: DUF4153 domain-containing protein [Pyrinomonadaceae bacterium]
MGVVLLAMTIGGLVVAAIVILGATNLMNPDAFIARTNIELMQQGREFDPHYNAQLRDDAIPVLISALPQMNLDDQCKVKSALHYRYREIGQSGDIRSLNLSRWTAFQLLMQNDQVMHDSTGCPDWMPFDS